MSGRGKNESAATPNESGVGAPDHGTALLRRVLWQIYGREQQRVVDERRLIHQANVVMRTLKFQRQSDARAS